MALDSLVKVTEPSGLERREQADNEMKGPPSLLRNYGAAAFARYAWAIVVGLPSRSSRSERRLVEPRGVEPLTSSLRTRRSPN